MTIVDCVVALGVDGCVVEISAEVLIVVVDSVVVCDVVSGIDVVSGVVSGAGVVSGLTEVVVTCGVVLNEIDVWSGVRISAVVLIVVVDSVIV